MDNHFFQFRVCREVFVFNSVPIIWSFLNLWSTALTLKKKQPQKSKKETQESTKEKKLFCTPVPSLPHIVTSRTTHHLKLLLCCLQPICLRKATNHEELLAGLDDSMFPKMHTAYFYHLRNQEPSICMKIARARRDGGPKTKTSTHPM